MKASRAALPPFKRNLSCTSGSDEGKDTSSSQRDATSGRAVPGRERKVSFSGSRRNSFRTARFMPPCNVSARPDPGRAAMTTREEEYGSDMVTSRTASVIETGRPVAGDRKLNRLRAGRTRYATLSSSNCGKQTLTPMASLSKAKRFTVKILSNWGAVGKLTLGSATFLDENKQAIDTIHVKPIPEMPEARTETLIDGVLVKSTIECWSVPWPPDKEHDIITLVMYVAAGVTPRYLRIWNAHQGDESGVKEVVVSESEEEVARGTVELGFGSDIFLMPRDCDNPYTDVNAVEKPVFREKVIVERRLCDGYGFYPSRKTRQLKIEIMATWGDVGTFALNALELFDQTGEIVDQKKIAEMRLDGCDNTKELPTLFRRDRYTITSKDQWISNVTDGWKTWPTITLEFREPVQLSLLVIYNFSAADMTRTICVKNVNVRVNGSSVWVGRLPKGTSHMDDIDALAPRVWFTDPPDVINGIVREGR